VVEFITDDGVLGPQQRFEQAAIGVESGSVKNDVLGSQEARKAFLQVAMDILGTANESHGTQAETPGVERLVRRGDDIGMRG